MNPKELAEAATPASLSKYLAGLPIRPHHHGGPTETIREDTYKGHRISIKTTYEITVDGASFPIPFAVDNDGQLNCHTLPAYQFLSAVELIRSIIDHFPDDFPKNGPASGGGAQPKEHQHSGHGHEGHQHGSHPHGNRDAGDQEGT